LFTKGRLFGRRFDVRRQTDNKSAKARSSFRFVEQGVERPGSISRGLLRQQPFEFFLREMIKDTCGAEEQRITEV